MNETKFKNTEIGLIPEDWEVKELGEIAVDMADGPFGSNLKTEHYTKEKQVRIIQLSNIGDSGWIDDNVKYTTFEHANTLKRCKANKGCVLIAKMMPAGRSIICPNEEKEYILGSDVVKVNFNDEIIESLYFVYHSKSSFFLEQIAENTQGSTRQRTSITKLRNMLIPLPTLAEQTRIATALSDIDSLIDSLDKLIQKKRNIKQGAMQELLTGKKRMKGFEKPWKEKTMGEIGYTYNGLTGKSKDDFGAGNSQYITFLNVLNNAILKADQFEKVDVKPSENQNKAKYGDLFFNTSSETAEEVGICAVLQNDIDNLYLNSFCFGFRITDKTNNGLFLSYLFRSKPGRDIMVSLAQGSTRYNLSKEQFLKATILLPTTLEEQTAIAELLSDMDSEIESLEAKKEKYKSIKQGMMQELLSGRIRFV